MGAHELRMFSSPLPIRNDLHRSYNQQDEYVQEPPNEDNSELVAVCDEPRYIRAASEDHRRVAAVIVQSYVIADTFDLHPLAYRAPVICATTKRVPVDRALRRKAERWKYYPVTAKCTQALEHYLCSRMLRHAAGRRMTIVGLQTSMPCMKRPDRGWIAAASALLCLAASYE